jgi:hypothetical protein
MLEWDEDKGCSCGQKEHPQGDFVYYSVYAEVKAGWQAAASRAISYIGQLGDQSAENARLKAECQARQAENSVLAVECDSLKAEVERLTGLLTQWKDIADAPTGHFIGYHKTKQGLIITGGIWVLEGKARFESGIGNEPTHWCEYPKYPEDIKS